MRDLTRARNQPRGEAEHLWEAIADPSRRKVLDLILVYGEATPTILAAQRCSAQAGAADAPGRRRAGGQALGAMGWPQIAHRP